MTRRIKETLIVAKYHLMIFFRYKANILWLTATPLVYIGIGLILFNLIGMERFLALTGGADSGSLYAVMGYAVYSLASYCYQCGNKVEHEIMAGTAKTNFLLPMHLSSYIYGISLSSLVSTGIFTFIMIGGTLIMAPAPLPSLLMGLGFLILALIYFFGIALIVCSVSLLVKRTGNIVNLLLFALQLLTGMMIPIRSLPPHIQALCLLSPTTWAIDAVRSSLLGLEPLGSFALAFWVLLGSAIAVHLLGNAILNRAETKMKRDDLVEGY